MDITQKLKQMEEINRLQQEYKRWFQSTKTFPTYEQEYLINQCIDDLLIIGDDMEEDTIISNEVFEKYGRRIKAVEKNLRRLSKR